MYVCCISIKYEFSIFYNERNLKMLKIFLVKIKFFMIIGWIFMLVKEKKSKLRKIMCSKYVCMGDIGMYVCVCYMCVIVWCIENYGLFFWDIKESSL